MNLSDRARDALKKATSGPWKTMNDKCYDEHGNSFWSPWGIGSEAGDTDIMWNSDDACVWSNNDDDVRLAALAPELASEVVRLHEQLGKLADELHDAKVYDRGDSSGQAWWVASRSASIRIRQALKGAEE